MIGQTLSKLNLQKTARYQKEMVPSPISYSCINSADTIPVIISNIGAKKLAVCE
ncbi:hypothetical protein N9N03_02955 [Chlamydiia bacterium]|nr:hypothetical protein [Chlamydiia bacterium]